jgi:hypothetical protein
MAVEIVQKIKKIEKMSASGVNVETTWKQWKCGLRGVSECVFWINGKGGRRM